MPKPTYILAAVLVSSAVTVAAMDASGATVTTIPRMRNSSEPAKITVANTGAHHHARGDWAATTPKAIPIGSAPKSAGNDWRIARRTSPVAAGVGPLSGFAAAVGRS